MGFYYKWFTRPPFVSRTFLRTIRPLTGVGRLPDAPAATRALPAADADAATAGRPEHDLGRWATVVVGAGAAGLRAAAAAAAEGPVLLLDENAGPGGLRLQALREIAASPVVNAAKLPLLGAARAALEAAAGADGGGRVDARWGHRVVAGYAPGGLLVRHGAELASLQADRVIWAGGALDLLGLFPGNDVPGALGPRALLRLLLRDGLAVAGRHALLVGGGLDLWLAATLLAARGARISLVLTEGDRHEGIAAAMDLKWQLNTGLALTELAAKRRRPGLGRLRPGRRRRRAPPRPTCAWTPIWWCCAVAPSPPTTCPTSWAPT